MKRSERARLKRLCKIEQGVRERGFLTIAGVDEVGRGCLAGPVVACACIIPDGVFVEGVNDSKKLLPQKRSQVFANLIASGAIFALGIIGPDVIDTINIHQATILAMKEAITGLSITPDIALIASWHLPELAIPQEKIPEGDRKVYSIAAASIIAKESRDRLMKEVYHVQEPRYGFDKHKGYGTKVHQEKLKAFGPCYLHRKSFLSKFMSD